MTNISTEQFEKQLEEQREVFNALKWRELEENKIFIIKAVEYHNTQFGTACILTLGDDQRVYAPSALASRLKQDVKPYPRYVRPTGKKQSKKNPAQTYYSFDLV